MSLTNKDRKNILNAVLENVAAVADKDYQKRVWIFAEGPECDDYDETCCDFFGDGDPMLEKYKDFGITQSQYEILKKFRDEFQAFSDLSGMKYSIPALFIDTPEWNKIVLMAQDVLKAFNYKKHM